MTFLDRIEECNEHDLNRYLPWSVAGEQVGWIRRDRVEIATRHVPALAGDDQGLAVDPALDTPRARTEAFETLVDDLAARGTIRARHGERYPVRTRWGAPTLMHVDRAVVAWLGIRAYGVHINAWLRRGDDLLMWIARRSRHKTTYPGQLDNAVAGGQPVDLSLRENVVKECGEEAGVPAALARTAQAVGAITYCAENDTGLKPDCMFCYDLELPGDFTPRCVDGEVGEFYLWSLEEVAARVRDTRDFKFNSSLVVIDFLARRGQLDEQGPEYVEIVKGLRSWGGQ